MFAFTDFYATCAAGPNSAGNITARAPTIAALLGTASHPRPRLHHPTLRPLMNTRAMSGFWIHARLVRVPLCSIALVVAVASTASGQTPTPELVDNNLAVRIQASGLNSPTSMAFFSA